VSHSVGVFLHDSLVYTNTCVMVNVSRFCEANNRMNQDVLRLRECGMDLENAVNAPLVVGGLLAR